MRRAMIATRVDKEILLVVGLCIIPLSRTLDLGGDRFALVPLLCHLLFDFSCNLQLFIVLGVDGGAILRAGVCALAVQGCRVVHLEKVLDELTVGHSFRVEDDQQGFGVAGAPGADIIIAGRFGVPTSISDSAIEKTLAVTPIFAIQFFEAPETAPGKDGSLGVWRKLHGGKSVGLEGHGSG